MSRYIQLKCFNCDPRYYEPGHKVYLDSEGYCTSCGRFVMENKDCWHESKLRRWDTYFHKLCIATASKSPCLSRQIGCILVREKVVIATGFNGPPRGYPHCGDDNTDTDINSPTFGQLLCPRRAKGYKSGEGLVECPATHAEANCIASAARIGASVNNSTLYLNCIIPCKDCMALIINAGIIEVVCDELKPYHEMSLTMAKKANIKLREFIL